MNRIVIVVLAGAALAVAGCATKEQSGGVVGGVLGGVAGAHVGQGKGRTAAIIAGTIIGAVIGQEVGRSIDRTDELRAQQVLERNATGQPSTWVNPDTGGQVTFVPTRTYEQGPGQYCREYQTDVIVGGRKEHGYGTACRQPDGTWKIMN